MARHRLDLLPLLDVFMVVLFVFATIQEGRLDDTTRSEQRLEERLAEAQAELRQARRKIQDHEHGEATVEAERSEDERARLAAQAESAHLREELAELREAFVEHRDETRQDLEAMGAPAEALELIEVLTKVLDKYSVFEIELVGVEGVEGDEGSVVNRCCYRVDPLVDEWHSCGEVPLQAEDRERWLDEGAGGLAAALRKTKGGNAMTLVRQDHAAGYRIAGRLVEQLRQRYADQHFYAEDEEVLEDHCGR